jgi:ABC-type dipeptide/oligopeptide/nickel transport system ATPase component
MRQRLPIAMAVALWPKVLLAGLKPGSTGLGLTAAETA